MPCPPSASMMTRCLRSSMRNAIAVRVLSTRCSPRKSEPNFAQSPNSLARSPMYPSACTLMRNLVVPVLVLYQACRWRKTGRPFCGTCTDQSSCTRAAFATSPHFCVSPARKAAKSCGERDLRLRAEFRQRLLHLGGLQAVVDHRVEPLDDRARACRRARPRRSARSRRSPRRPRAWSGSRRSRACASRW